MVPSSQGHGREWGRYIDSGVHRRHQQAQGWAQTYDELLANDRLDHGERLKLRGEATISQASHLLIGQGHDKIVGLFLDVDRIEVDPREDGFDDDSLWLEVAPEHMSGFTEDVTAKIRDACSEIERRKSYGIWFAGAREILPEVGPGWQDNLRQLLGGKPTDHARRIYNEPPRWVDDGLSFTNDGELKVYKALKKIQATYPNDDTLGIFPLAAGRLPGRTWEPDALRQKLAAAARDARKQEEARRFAKQAQDLADLLNADFSTQAQRLRDIRAATSRPGSAAAVHGAGASGDQEADLWVEGQDQPGEPDTPSSYQRTGKGGGPSRPKRPPDWAVRPKTGSRSYLRLQVKASASGLAVGSASLSGTSAKAKTGRSTTRTA